MALMAAQRAARLRKRRRLNAFIRRCPGFRILPPKPNPIIYLHMNGGPSQLDTWDYKPHLADHFDKDLPDSIRMGQRITTMTSGQARLPVAPSLFKFARYGQAGTWASELLNQTAQHIDDIALVRSVHTNAINHDPACTFVTTGSEVPGKPSVGSWLAYGLGSDSNNLPAFVVLTPRWSSKQAAQALFSRMWSSGFLPSKYTGVALRSVGDPVLYIDNPDGISAESSASDAGQSCRNSISVRLNASVIRKRRLGLLSTKWHFGCRAACRNLSICPVRRRRRSTCTGRKFRNPEHLLPAHCSRAAWSNAECALSRFCIVAGISMARCRAKFVISATTQTSPVPRCCRT